MPYKDKRKQRECERRWRKRNKNAYRKKKAIQALARIRNKKRQKCSIKKCNTIGDRHHPDYSQPKEIIWLCKKHHNIIHSNPIKRLCSVKDCAEQHRAKGYCINHYMSEYARKTIDIRAIIDAREKKK